jgi:dTDP-4-dehydrorhamnose 3,5-epimerase
MIIENFSSKIFEDSRGSNNLIFEDAKTGICYKESHSKKNVFRGLHIQIPPNYQEKFISVSKGSVMDYILCLDHESEHYGQLKQFEITPDEGFFKIPKYCAHGYLALEDSVFSYICVGKYSEEDEITILMKGDFYLDKIVSDKDTEGISYDEAIEMFNKINWK